MDRKIYHHRKYYHPYILYIRCISAVICHLVWAYQKCLRARKMPACALPAISRFSYTDAAPHPRHHMPASPAKCTGQRICYSNGLPDNGFNGFGTARFSLMNDAQHLSATHRTMHGQHNPASGTWPTQHDQHNIAPVCLSGTALWPYPIYRSTDCHHHHGPAS